MLGAFSKHRRVICELDDAPTTSAGWVTAQIHKASPPLQSVRSNRARWWFPSRTKYETCSTTVELARGRVESRKATNLSRSQQSHSNKLCICLQSIVMESGPFLPRRPEELIDLVVSMRRPHLQHEHRTPAVMNCWGDYELNNLSNMFPFFQRREMITWKFSQKWHIYRRFCEQQRSRKKLQKK